MLGCTRYTHSTHGRSNTHLTMPSDSSAGMHTVASAGTPFASPPSRFTAAAYELFMVCMRSLSVVRMRSLRGHRLGIVRIMICSQRRGYVYYKNDLDALNMR